MHRVRWPDPVLNVPASGSTALDRELARVAWIWMTVRSATASLAENGRQLEETRRAAGYPDDPLVSLESDFFLLGLASATLSAAKPTMRRSMLTPSPHQAPNRPPQPSRASRQNSSPPALRATS